MVQFQAQGPMFALLGLVSKRRRVVACAYIPSAGEMAGRSMVPWPAGQPSLLACFSPHPQKTTTLSYKDKVGSSRGTTAKVDLLPP